MRTTRFAVSQLLVTAAVAFSLTTAAHASAERSWDIDVYDDCIGRGVDIGPCCVLSDGDLTQDKPPKCVAPPAEAVDVPGNPAPTVTGKPRPPHLPGTSVG